jgi:hypothetical protein
MEISDLKREDEAAWDAYIYKSRTSTFYHQLRSVLIKLFQSLMVEKTYKHRPDLSDFKRRRGYEVLSEVRQEPEVSTPSSVLFKYKKN